MDSRRLIGRGNALPWRLPADMRRFRHLTMGKPVIMGRKTFESIGRVLDGRVNIVVSQASSFDCEGAIVVRSIEAALAACDGHDEVMVLGGASIYAQMLPMSGRMYLTLICDTFDGDSYFPEFDSGQWKETAREDHPAGDQAPFGFTFQTLERVAGGGPGCRCPLVSS